MAKCTESYSGQVKIDNKSWSQQATGTSEFKIEWPGLHVRSTSTLCINADERDINVNLTLQVWRDGTTYFSKTWHECVPREL